MEKGGWKSENCLLFDRLGEFYLFERLFFVDYDAYLAKKHYLCLIFGKFSKLMI